MALGGRHTARPEAAAHRGSREKLSSALDRRERLLFPSSKFYSFASTREKSHHFGNTIPVLRRKLFGVI